MEEVDQSMSEVGKAQLQMVGSFKYRARLVAEIWQQLRCSVEAWFLAPGPSFLFS